MAADPKLLLTTQPEKPNHYTYLKEFRVEQCQSFLQHKCNQHRPFICFNWHFMNQRRRRPVRKRDGTFNYSADNYCAKYDETTGICPDGDDCPFLHRTAGDTERRYHLRYYKTCMCVHDTDTRGYCVKNGHHCAFAHGLHDQRPPVFDIKEIESTQIETNGLDLLNAPNALDKERNLMNEDPKWQDTNFVLANYKTESCKRPPRLCRQGYACPQFHNSKDKRRSPRKFKYRSTPCPNVKHGEEWGEPANCEAGDNCQYCHTRTEQQFHPEIYKSTKCNDVQQAGYCPRSVFCAFAHVEQEIPHGMDGMALGELLSNVMIAESKKDRFGPDMLMHNGSGESCESASTSSVGSNQSHSKAPGAQLHHNHNKHNLFQNNLNNNNNNGLLSASIGQINLPFPDYTTDLTKQFMVIDNDPLLSPMEKEQRKRMCLNFSIQTINPLDKYSNNLEDSSRRDFSHIDNPISASLTSSSLLHNSTQPVNIPNSHMSNSLTGLLQGTSAPVNIPDNFSSSGGHSNMFGGHFSHLSGSAPKMNNSFSAAESLFFQPHIISPVLNDTLSISPDLRLSNALRDELANNSFFENGVNSHQHNSSNGQQQHGNNGAILPSTAKYSMSPALLGNTNEITRLRDELASHSVNKIHWEERIMQAGKACDAWRSEADESNRKAVIAEQQRDDALTHVQLVNEKLEQANGGLKGANLPRDWRGMSIHTLKGIQNKLRSDLEEVEKVLYQETTNKCMSCEEHPRSVTFMPCNHYVSCDQCAKNARECPYCHVSIDSQA